MKRTVNIISRGDYLNDSYRDKAKDRAKISKQIEEFLERGGEIKQLSPYARREPSTISVREVNEATARRRLSK